MESCYLHDENHMVMQTSTHPPTHTLTQQHCFAPPMGLKAPAPNSLISQSVYPLLNHYTLDPILLVLIKLFR